MLRDLDSNALRASVARVLPPEGFAESDLRLLTLEGREALSEPFVFRLLIASPLASIDANALLGKPMGVALELPGARGKVGQAGGTRYFQGHVAAFEHGVAQGRFFGYAITLRPWTWLVDRNRDCRIFQERATPEIVRAVLAEWPEIARYESRLTARYAHRRYSVQYRESDFAYIARLLEEDGISYHFEHDAKGHTLVLTDPGSERLAMPAYEAIRVDAGRAAQLGEIEAITAWHPARVARASRVTLADYDFKQPAVRLRAGRDETPAHAHGDAEVFDPHGGFFNDVTEGPAGDADEPLGELRAQLALERLAVAAHVVSGEATARGVAAGARLTLADAPAHAEQRDVLVTSVAHSLDVAPPESRRPDAGARYRARFTVLPIDVPYRPARATPRPRIEGLQSAVVLGPKDAEIHTDAYGRVKLGFHWDRNARGDRKPGSDGQPLPDDQRTCWIRVAEPWAGQAWGGTLLPRVGQEVLVDFIEGNPDRPVVTGRVVNAAHLPVAFSAVGSLPANHALAGFRSKELGAQRYNELLFDDTAGELRVKLSSEHAKTQLNLGHLTHPRDGGKAPPRGEGFELRTDAWGSLRAAKGVLVSADARLHAASTQMDRQELIGALEAALALAKSLGIQAKEQGAGDADAKPQQALAQAAKQWGAGANAERDASADAPGGQPIVAISAPAGIAIASAQAVTVASATHTDLVAQKNVQLASAAITSFSAGTGIALFAHAGGIHSIAHRGAHVVQAQSDDVIVNAKRDVLASATEGHVLVQAAQHITLVESKGAYIRIQGGSVEIGGPGRFLVKMASYSFTGPTSKKIELPKFVKSDTGKQFRLRDPASGRPIADAPVAIAKDTGGVIEAKTDADGRTPLDASAAYEYAQAVFRLPKA